MSENIEDDADLLGGLRYRHRDQVNAKEIRDKSTRPFCLPKALAACLERKLSGQETLLPDDPAIEAVALRAIDQYKVVEQKREDKEVRQEQQQLMTVDVSTLATSHHRSLGPELVAQKA
ncbi:MAG: transposase IS4 family protein, partial [Bacillota bacterium]